MIARDLEGMAETVRALVRRIEAGEASEKDAFAVLRALPGWLDHRAADARRLAAPPPPPVASEIVVDPAAARAAGNQTGGQ